MGIVDQVLHDFQHISPKTDNAKPIRHYIWFAFQCWLVSEGLDCSLLDRQSFAHDGNIQSRASSKSRVKNPRGFVDWLRHP